MPCIPVVNYLKNAKGLPFFYSVGDENYLDVLSDLKHLGLSVIRVSDFCKKEDKFPDLDDLIDSFRTGDVDYRDNRFVVIGLGEYLALSGPEEIVTELGRLKNTTLGNARVILLLRGISKYVSDMIAGDRRLTEQGRVYLGDNVISNISAINTTHKASGDMKSGIKGLLHSFEDGETVVQFSSNRSFDNSIIPISVISGAYATLNYLYKPFDLPKEYGSDEQWERMLTEVQKLTGGIEQLFDRYHVSDRFEDEIYSNASGYEFKNWLFFISLKANIKHIQNAYLALVIERTTSFESFKDNLLVAITGISHTDTRFKKLYEDRKRLLRGFPESDIAIFVKQNSIDPQEEIYRLTDNTQLERRQILKCIVRDGWNESYSYVYPSLGMYLKTYVFDCGMQSKVLTDYFERYKHQKVSNVLEEDFVDLVEDYGNKYIYSKIQTRDNAISSIPNRQSAYLYWIDALGVEYLSLISELAKKHGLSVKVEIGRADLPTITSLNKSFYDNWDGIGKYKEETLDDIKHHEKGGFFFTDCEEPIHLESEIGVIEKALMLAQTKLAMHECKSFIIASDHGASRLAVLRKQEEKYSTDTKGEHSGRCCKTFENCQLRNLVEEQGYYVRTDYGRFQGSRKANVEVHGGATLEEVLVPIITITLKKQGSVEIKVLNADKIQADRKIGTRLSIYISEVDNQNNVSLVIGEKKYIAVCIDATHYEVVLEDIKRAKSCHADVFDGDNLLGGIDFKIKSKSGNVDSTFDSEFDDF